MQNLIEMLKGGGPKMLGRSKEVAALIGKNRTSFDIVFEKIFGDDRVAAFRAADACEIAAKDHPEFLVPHMDKLLDPEYTYEDPRLRMHVSQILGYAESEGEELARILEILFSWLRDEEHIFVKAHLMTAVANQSFRNTWLIPEVISVIEAEMERGSAAIKARGRILLKKLYKLS